MIKYVHVFRVGYPQGEGYPHFGVNLRGDQISVYGGLQLVIEHIKLTMGDYSEGVLLQVVCSPEAEIYIFALPGGKYEVRRCTDLGPEEQRMIVEALDHSSDKE